MKIKFRFCTLVNAGPETGDPRTLFPSCPLTLYVSFSVSLGQSVGRPVGRSCLAGLPAASIVIKIDLGSEVGPFSCLTAVHGDDTYRWGLGVNADGRTRTHIHHIRSEPDHRVGPALRAGGDGRRTPLFVSGFRSGGFMCGCFKRNAVDVSHRAQLSLLLGGG